MRHILWTLLLLGLLASAVIAQECTDDDYEGQYTQCRPDNTHDLVYYLKRNSTCTNGTLPKHPVFDLPCNITCGEGAYLPLGSLVCSPCNPGTFTRGGGQSATEWKTWPTDLGIFSTLCINNEVVNSPPLNCSGWVLTGGTVRSGVITDVQSSILILQTQLILSGVVRFSYRVSAEPTWDGLIFYIDGVIALPKTSVTNSFVDFVANVTAGYHTLKWEYSKDRSVSRGEDAAFIRSIEIVGISYAEPSCTPCEAGTYTNASSSIQCSPCPLNTFASDAGSTNCTACPDGQFSYVGATECKPKVPCTAADYQILYGPCSSSNTRSGTASWLQPHFCDDSGTPLPDSTTSPCPACPPGTTQDASFNCVSCPTGTYSSGGSAACQPCGAGHAAPRVFNFSSFDSWPTGASTSCIGECGSSGWRLRSNYIDSGAGHGETVDSSFNIQLTLEQPGFVTFTFQLNCTRFCALYFLDFPYDAAIQWNTSSVVRNRLVTYTTPVALEVGPHNLTWTFESQPYDPIPNNYTDAAQIYSIVVNGTNIGGASKCYACVNGTVAVSGSSFCSNCTAGYSSDSTFSQCVACAGNTYSPHTGGPCYDCGPTTTVNSNNTDCIDTCTFVLNGRTYDLTSLAKKPAGPVYDGSEYYYYINLCGRGNFVDDCHDIDDVPLNTHVCQILPYNYSLDVGWSTGYYPISSTIADQGFRAHYDMGTIGCGPKFNGAAIPRNSDVNFICDPTAGVGSLQGGKEDTPCHYSFVWRSLYACPICNTSDYTYYYTLCGSNGKRNKIYYWIDPILCHDGVKLPSNEEVSCSDSTVMCGVGQQLSEDGQTCIPCPSGEYSVGGGLLIRSWPAGDEDLAYGYSTSCVGSCTPWISDDGMSIHSGFGESSLYGSHVFRIAGNISFDYKVFTHSDGVFMFYVDGLPQLEVNTSLYEWNSFTFDVNPGSHIFQWKFLNGIRYSTSLLTLQTVSVYNILVQGLDYHADSCLPCPDGTYSSPDPTVLGCLVCPANTYNTAQTSQCAQCPSGQFSLPGSTYCSNKTLCTSASYVPQYTACVNGTRDVSYTPLLPQICTGGTPPPPSKKGIPCAACPPYTVAQESTCVSCPVGQYFDGVCKQNQPGHIVQYSQYYFNDDSTTSWPEGFYTGCSGVCGTDGWRFAGASIDSGYHGSNVVDSYVGVLADFVYNGQVTFTYVLNTFAPLDGFQFTIDDVVVPVQIPQNGSAPVTVNVPVSTGLHRLVWNYHQETSSGHVSMSNIVLRGVMDGASAVASIPCEPGLFSTDPTATNCSLCPPGTYSGVAGSMKCAECFPNTYNPNFGADECTPCESGSSSNKTGSTQCSTSCIFSIGPDVYDLTGLPSVTVYDDARRKYMISVCKNVGSQCPNSHSCIVGLDNNVTEAGNSFRFIPDADNSTASPFAIAFEHGDLCPGTTTERSTTIQFECDAESPFTSPDFQAQDDKCEATFSWRSSMACRRCTDNDYATVTGACSGGRRQVSRTRISQCNGASSIVLKDSKCSGQEFPLAAILVIVFIFIAVVAVAAFIFFRNRKLTAKYASLMEETRSNAL